MTFFGAVLVLERKRLYLSKELAIYNKPHMYGKLRKRCMDLAQIDAVQFVQRAFVMTAQGFVTNKGRASMNSDVSSTQLSTTENELQCHFLQLPER